MYIIFLYQIVINAIFPILNENIFIHFIRQMDVKKIRIPDKNIFWTPANIYALLAQIGTLYFYLPAPVIYSSAQY